MTFYCSKAALHIALADKSIQFVPIEGSTFGSFETEDAAFIEHLQSRDDVVGPDEFETATYPQHARELIKALRDELQSTKAKLEAVNAKPQDKTPQK